MASRSRFTKLDAFTKTVDEARVRTTSGGIVTIASILIVLYLVLGEWADYRRVVLRPELVVDKTRGEKMEIWMNITFPHVPCELLTLDVMDVAGEIQTGVKAGISKVRLAPPEEGGREIDVRSVDLHADEATHLDPSYCGECAGAPPPPNAQKPGCCQTCEEVRDAYAAQSWAFATGAKVEQCEREHYAERLAAQRKEGCRIEGGIRVNKVVGNFHIAPGRSYSQGNMHTHDLHTYWEAPEEHRHSFAHTIHHLRFGPKVPEDVARKFTGKGANMPWTNHQLNPLDGTSQITRDPTFNYMYFVKVVSTSYLPLGWKSNKPRSTLVVDDNIDLGRYGQSTDGSLETHQYSVTSHKRSLRGGNDEKEGHREREHARNGIPGVFFSYDISPMKVVNREERGKTLAGFITGLCAVVGGTLTVAAAIDRGLYEGVSRLRKIQSKTM